jgi:hypothetical protein
MHWYQRRRIEGAQQQLKTGTLIYVHNTDGPGASAETTIINPHHVMSIQIYRRIYQPHTWKYLESHRPYTWVLRIVYQPPNSASSVK